MATTSPPDRPPRDATTSRILDAAIEAAAVHGLSRLSMSDVAARAGISRPTLYKRFASKDALVAEAVLREADGMVEQVLAAAAEHDDPARALTDAVLVTLRLAREHPLLDRIVRTEPEALVPLLIADPNPVLSFGRTATEAVVAAKAPELSPLAVRRLADILLRLLVSYALTPPDDPPEVVAAAVAGVVTAGLDAAFPDGHPNHPEHR